MKKNYYSLLAAATMLMAATSCSQEEDFTSSSNDMTTFEISLEGAAQTRAAGDGTKVNKLYYAVYDKETQNVIYPYQEGENPAQYKVETITGGVLKVNLPLMRSETYDILFWAQAGETNAAYSFTELTDITINYDNALSNIEERDAFFNALNDFTISGSQNKIVLRRPFAQLNVATTMADWNDAVKLNANPVTKSAVTVSALATKFNVLTGEASEATEASVPFGANAIVNETLTLKRMVEGVEKDVEYKHLAMNYLLPVGRKAPNGIGEYSAAEGKANVEVEFTLYKNDTEKIVNVKVPATPIQRNFRTNIIGDLLTGEDFEIIIDKEFDGTENQEIEISVDGIVKDKNGVFHITKAEGLEAFADLVNYGSSMGRAAETPYTFAGETFVLDCDVDLQGAEWTPIGNGKTSFQGTFDGNGKTVSNFKVTEKDGYVGLFGRVHTGAVKNLTVKNVTLKAYHYAGGIVGQGYVKIDNCHVENITISLSIDPTADSGKGDFGDKAGGIIGQNCEGGLYVKGCTAKKVTITGYRDLGGIAGMAHNNNIVSKNTVEDIVIIQDITNAYKEDIPETLGAIIGREGSNVTKEENSGEATIIKTAAEEYPGYYVDANGKYIVTENKGITALIEKNETTINLADGSFTIPTSLQNKELTFTGSRNAELDLTPAAGNMQNVSGATLSFNGITVKYGTENYKGMQHAKAVTYNDCAINGLQFLYAPTTFTNCDLNSNGAEHCIWTYGATEATFTDCTFTYGDRAVNCYSESGTSHEANVTFTDCIFIKVAGAKTTGAIETNSSSIKSLALNINNCTVNEGDLWWVSTWDVKEGENTTVTLDGNRIVTTAAQLNAALADDSCDEIYLENGTTFEGTFKPARKVIITSSANNKAIIKGRVNIPSDASGIQFENIKFEINDASKKQENGADSFIADQSARNNYQHPAVVMVYNSAVSFEGCEFTDLYNSHEVVAINYGSGTNKMLSINDCTFQGYAYAIRSRALISVTNCSFNHTHTSANPRAIWVWGLGDSAGEIVFTGNTAADKAMYALQMTAKNYAYKNIKINVQNNTNLVEGPIMVNTSNCTYENITFAEGSKTFEF